VTRTSDLWVYLSASPLTWLGVTLIAYVVADRIAVASGRHPLVNPVALSIAFVAAVLLASGTGYATYFEGAQFIHVLLGPATVALAVPIVRRRREIVALARPLAAALAAGAIAGIASAVGFAQLFGASSALVASIAPKSVTAAIAMGVSEVTGGVPALTAALVVTTGIVGAVMVTPLMNLMRVGDPRARGFAAGVAAHGIGTARAFAVSPVAGTYAGLAMALNGVLTALLAPIVLRALSQ